MKKLMILLLLFPLLAACAGEKVTDGGTELWYLRSTYHYGTEASMFACEYTETVVTDPISALTSYFKGPRDHTLRNPFPENTALVRYETRDGTAAVTVSDAFAQGSPADIQCAAVCLAKTVAGISQCDTVSIYLESEPKNLYMCLSAADFSTTDNVITDVVTTPENEVTT